MTASRVIVVVGLLALLPGCATAQLVGEPAFTPEDPGTARNVVIEPLFELAQLQTTTRTEYARLSSAPYGMSPGFGFGYGSGFNSMPQTVAVTRQVQEKPFFAKPATLVELQARVLAEVQRRRPSWRVTSTGGAQLLRGDATIVRTIIEGNELIASNRTLKNLAFGFGLLIWPLQFFNLEPVEETTRVYGLVERFTLDSAVLPSRLVKYPSQPDFAVNLAGVPSQRHEFGLDVTYTEGLLADERPRSGVLIDGFVDRLAAAVIALVEEAP
jgi:hypothetical protein